MTDERRYKVLKVHGQFWLEWFKRGSPGFLVTKDPLPADTTVIDVRYNAWDGNISILIESAEFEPLADGEQPPEITPPSYRAVPDTLDFSLN